MNENMNKKNKKSNIIIIVVIFLVILSIISLLFYFKLKTSKTFEIEATVKMIGDNYIVVETDEGKEYSLPKEEKYNIGDRVDFVIKDIKKNTYPLEGTITKIDTISEKVIFKITDSKDNNKENNLDKVTNVEQSDDVVAYFNNLNNKIDDYEKDKSIGQTIK